MARHILKYDELESYGHWSCISIKDVGKIGNQWWTPARALGMELTDYIKMIIRDFHPDNISFSTIPENGLLLFSWNKQEDMRKFKNWINKKFRDLQFYVD